MLNTKKLCKRRIVAVPFGSDLVCIPTNTEQAIYRTHYREIEPPTRI